MKVHEVADAEMAHSEIGQQLRFVRWENGGYGLDFDNDDVADDDVGAKAAGDQLALVGDRDAGLASEVDPGCFEFPAQAGGVNDFQQPGTDGAVDVDRVADDALRQVLVFVHGWNDFGLSGSRIDPAG